MPQRMTEAFARGLVDKIMLEAFDVLDTGDQDGKSVMMNCQPDSANIESQALEVHDHTYANCNGETTELVEKMVRGLRDLQIGDSLSVSSDALTKLEKQVKRVVCNIGSASLGDLTEAAETRIIQGQGDVHQLMLCEVIETASDSTGLARKKETSTETTRVPVGLLVQAIEELETNDTVRQTDAKSECVERDGISAWEENEELFIRTIESVDDTDQSNMVQTFETEAVNHSRSLEYEVLKSSSLLNSASLAKNVCLEEVAIQQNALKNVRPEIATVDEIRVESSRPKSQKKKRGLLGRMRKLLRSVLARRKN